MKYDFFIIDAQYYLRRNWCVVKSNPDFSHYELMKSLIFTIFKIYKIHGGRKIILLWDKRPYKKEEIIKDYKSDRYLVVEDRDNTSNRIDELNKLLSDPTLDENTKNKYMNELNILNNNLLELEFEANQFLKIGKAKYEFLSKFNNFGLVSIQIPGYEADDLAYLCGKWCLNNNMTALLVSGDSDWSCMSNKNVDVLRYTKNYNELYKYDDSVRKIPIEHKDIKDPFKYYQLCDIYNGGHNNVVLDLDRKYYSVEQLIEYINSNNYPDDLIDFKRYFDALCLVGYYDEIESTLSKKLLKSGSLKRSDFYDYQNNVNLMGNYIHYYWSVIKNLDWSLFLDE